MMSLPHSPRWLQHIGRAEDSVKAWERLGYSAAEAEKEQEVEQRQGNEVTSTSTPRRKGSTSAMLFAKDIRKRTALGVFLMAMQQVRGTPFHLGNLHLTST